uniref:hypothetical protein n=1 Tax=Onion yellows phytoplasma TaxID=100379 RepID=UPI0018664B86|nr:hypothetical protein [Onion yellows phytoplasma]
MKYCKYASAIKKAFKYNYHINYVKKKYNEPHIKPNNLLDNFQIKELTKKEEKEKIKKALNIDYIDLDKDF